MNATPHVWRFFRAGGFDQVRIETATDLLALDQLDQKLWVALSCPVTGIEFDPRTLALIDADQDGHIRANELLAAIRWAAERLANTEVLGSAQDGLPIDAIKDEALAAAARALLNESDRSDGLLTVAEASDAEARCRARLELAWQASGAEAQVAGIDVAAAHAALEAVRAKIDDYFARCRLAAFDPRAAEALNADTDSLKALGAANLHAEAEGIAALPLARVEAHRALPLNGELNPAWTARISAFVEATRPLLGFGDTLDESDWKKLQDALAPYATWLAANPCNCIGSDSEPAELAAARDLERLVRYVRDLLPLANNFVAFRGFYTRQSKASFQVGTLYLDGRSAELCVAVSDVARHASLAGLARMYLVYCDCVRRDDSSAQKMTVAAAITAGDSDQLIVGRNGVFYDRQGRDWDATIVRIVDHPISLRQAFWSPYKRLARMIGEQVQKFAANRAANVEGQLTTAVLNTSKKVEGAAVKTAVPAVAPTPFDVGKFAGVFAAIGLAVGALGTALASVITGLLGLHWWQMPIALAGLLLTVSGPAMLMAAFKLRARNLGPLLDANGWAINARARINIPFGTSLTGLAQLPAGAQRSLTDPYADKRQPWGLYLFLLVAVVGGFLVWWKLS